VAEKLEQDENVFDFTERETATGARTTYSRKHPKRVFGLESATVANTLSDPFPAARARLPLTSQTLNKPATYMSDSGAAAAATAAVLAKFSALDLSEKGHGRPSTQPPSPPAANAPATTNSIDLAALLPPDRHIKQQLKHALPKHAPAAKRLKLARLPSPAHKDVAPKRGLFSKMPRTASATAELRAATLAATPQKPPTPASAPAGKSILKHADAAASNVRSAGRRNVRFKSPRSLLKVSFFPSSSLLKDNAR
jgi:hypothetical protein